ncbi:MAG: DNA-processing protein DprA [Bacteroidota bacterium]
MENLIYKIGIGLIPKIGDVTAKKLIAYCGGVDAVFQDNKAALKKIPGINTAILNEIANQTVLSKAEKEIKFIEKNNIKPLFYLDENYPTRLKHCNDGPIMLYYQGNANLNTKKVLAVVGTRRSTDYGKIMCEEVVSQMASLDVLIVSGLAYGIDICAHKSAIHNDLPTVGVLGHGLDKLYPAEHRKVADQMIENGGLLTEFMSESRFEKENFPKRNRIIAGMADATLVVEAAAKGGALITAEIANSYNRDVFAFPGRASDTYSKGCNFLIKTNRAALAESGADIIYLMDWMEKTSKKKTIQQQLFVELTEEEQLIKDILLQQEHIAIDSLAIKCNLPVSRVSAMLLNMEFVGVVRTLPGKIYQLV